MNTLWIARDEDGDLTIYRATPEVFDNGNGKYYSCDDTGYYGGLDMPLPSDMYTDLFKNRSNSHTNGNRAN